MRKNNYIDEDEKDNNIKKILKFIRTNNKIERFFKEIRRRIKLIEGFENDESIERFFYNLVKYESKRKRDIY
ncbi:transposase [Candidatus Dependentiae bacterium]|nr:transposase [Candidatus Dependentiae bacterium]